MGKPVAGSLWALRCWVIEPFGFLGKIIEFELGFTSAHEQRAAADLSCLPSQLYLHVQGEKKKTQ